MGSFGISLEQLFQFIGPMEEKSHLRELFDLFSERTDRDHAIILHLIKGVFEWEQDKYKFK